MQMDFELMATTLLYDSDGNDDGSSVASTVPITHSQSDDSIFLMPSSDVSLTLNMFVYQLSVNVCRSINYILVVSQRGPEMILFN